jgi:hypothetical protein
MAGRIRIVVGEGRTAQRGLLRFVLEGEGFDVVGEARSSADLSGAIEAQRPDVVVLDDGIGVTAVSMVHELDPHAKVVLVWPSFVVPIGGDARVEPAKILRDLGPAVEHVMGVAAGLTAFERPDWIDKVRKDPATLRDKLLLAGAAGTAAGATKRPSVTSLQKRGKRLHPTGRRSKQTDPQRRDVVPAPIILLPSAGSESEPVLDIGGADPASGSADETVVERSEWNRRLGSLALSGAAAVSALVLALALGGGRIPVSVVRGGGVLPPGVPGLVRPGIEGPFGAGSLGGSGYNPVPPVERPAGPDQGANGGTNGLAAPGTGGSDVPAPAPGDGGTGGSGGGTGGGGGGTGGGGGAGGGGGGTGGGGSGGGGGGTDGGGTDGGGVKGADTGMPGKSAEHNPHGGPPSKLGLTPAHGQGLGVGIGSTNESKPKHVHKH